MSGAELALAASVFAACTVEAVEALTIVLAVGSTRGWRWAMAGVGAGLGTLSAIVAAAGPALTSLPLAALRIGVGLVLLLFGLHWLRKAVLRAAHRKALHDELQVYGDQVAAALAQGARRREGFDRYCFTVAFQGVFVEGVEIVVIVLSFSASRGHLGIAAGAAGLAVVCVALAGLAVRSPLARVPENTMKLLVGVMLTAFGVFWLTDGLGLHWPGGDAALLAIAAAVLFLALVSVALLRPHVRSRSGPSRSDPVRANAAAPSGELSSVEES